MNYIDYKKILIEVEKVIVKAGEILLSYFRKDMERVNKADQQGFVTEADFAAENFLMDRLSKILPESRIYAEESGSHNSESKSQYCWVIDPLDGTTNFAYGIPYFSISIALTYNNKPILAVVYDPITKESFKAFSNGGTYLNGQKVQVSHIEKLDQAFLLLSVPYVKDRDYDKLLKISHIIDQKSYVTRQLGSVVLDAAYVACGRVEGYYFNNLAWWDLAAGMLLIQEAGGLVTEFNGDPITPDYKTCLGGNSHIYEQLQIILKKY